MTPEEMARMQRVLTDVIRHLDLQRRKWGVQNHRPERWIAIAGEEYGEACKAWLDSKPGEYREEVLSIAAVCIHAVECLDRHQAMLEDGKPPAYGPIENGIETQ